MFNSLSWLDFLNCLAVVMVDYYVVVYILSFVKKFPKNCLIKSAQIVSGEEHSANMMGTIKPDCRVNRKNSSVDVNQITIAPDEVEDPSIDLDGQIGPSVSDLLQEIKALTNVIQDGKGTEAQSLSMYKILIQKNSHLASSSYKEVINKFLHDQCTNVFGFQIDISEIRLWWSNN